jgi:hypothetical protein
LAPPYKLLGLAALPSSSVRLSHVYGGYCLPHYHIVLFHRLSVTHARLACSLPYTWAKMPHIRTDPTPFRVVAGSKPRASYPRAISHFTILHFYLGRPRILQSSYTSKTSGRSHPHNGVRIRIRSSTLPRTIAYTIEQLH